jgi:non-specific protein-tyrosine kinase
MVMEIELGEYLAPLRRWWWLLIVTTLVAGGSSYLATRQQVPLFRSTTTLMIGNAIDDPNPTSAQFSTTRQLAATYVDIAGRASVRNAAAEALGLERLTEEILVRQLNDTNLIDLIVTDTDPRRAQAVANELARQLILRSPTGQKADDQAFVNELLQDYATQITETQKQIGIKQEELGRAVGAREISDIQAELGQMEITLRTLSTDYSNLRSSTQQGATNTIRVIEPASLPQLPVEPNNMVTILTAAGIGFVLSASAAYVLEYLDDTVRTPEMVAKLTQLPMLAGIASMKSKDDDKLITISQPRSPTAEAFRVLRTAIQFSSPDKDEQVLLLTSAMAEEGKTTISSNLSVVLAQAGHRVLLVDADLRRPSLHSIFGVSNKRGLTSMLLEFSSSKDDTAVTDLIEQTVQETKVNGLQLLASGPIAPNPSELLGSNKMRHILAALASVYDFILIDSPPALSVTDAVVLSAQVDAVLLVTRSGKSRRALVRQMAERFREMKVRVIGYVLNDLQPNRSYGMYYYEDPYLSIDPEPAVSQETNKADAKVQERILRRQTT